MRILASTSWVGALARAAGATDVTLVAPASFPSPPVYKPKPIDVAAVAGADFVLCAKSDGFAGQLTEAAGRDPHLFTVELKHTPQSTRAEVTRLAGLFGTEEAGAAWLSTFDTEYAMLRRELTMALPHPAPTVVSHGFLADWAGIAGPDVAGTFGPEPVTADKLAELAALDPGIVIGDSGAPRISGAANVGLTTYPRDDLDLMSVFRANVDALKGALR